MSEGDVERIELRIAFLENAAAELSDVVYRQQCEIEALRAQVMELASRAAANAVVESALSVADEKPPHY